MQATGAGLGLAVDKAITEERASFLGWVDGGALITNLFQRNGPLHTYAKHST